MTFLSLSLLLSYY